ncbi:hypothetical protein Hanom_Chr11g01059761 [Helianthus anomalus]
MKEYGRSHDSISVVLKFQGKIIFQYIGNVLYSIIDSNLTLTNQYTLNLLHLAKH